MVLLYFIYYTKGFFIRTKNKLTITSKCSGRPSWTWAFCSSLHLFQLWENMPFIVRQTARARSVRAFSVFSIVFRLCPKQLNQGQPKLRTATLMLLPLSVVTQDMLLSFNPQSCRASCKASAKLAAVWSPGKKLVWRHFDISVHSVSMKWKVSHM